MSKLFFTRPLRKPAGFLLLTLGVLLKSNGAEAQAQKEDRRSNSGVSAPVKLKPGESSPRARNRSQASGVAAQGGPKNLPDQKNAESQAPSAPVIPPANPLVDPSNQQPMPGAPVDPNAPQPSPTPVDPTAVVPPPANPFTQPATAGAPGPGGAMPAPLAPPSAGGGAMPMIQQMMPMMQSTSGGYRSSSSRGGGGGGGSGSGGGGSGRGAYTCHHSQTSACQCANAQGPSKAAVAIKEATEFYRSCLAGNPRVKSENIAINDYSGRVGCMYIVDSEGQCKYATTSDYGSGSGVPPKPGCGNGSHMTPAGFHLTGAHSGGSRYNSSNSLLMIGLQGQRSAERGILIHQGRCGGGAATWGCAGVGDFGKVRSLLGYGALVYNYFEDNVGNCSGARQKTCGTDMDPPRSEQSGNEEAPPERQLPTSRQRQSE